jgi:hypothetical protein
MSYFGLPLYPTTLPNQQAVVNIVGTTTLGAGAATYDKQFMISGAGGYTITLPVLDGVNFPSKSYSIFNNSSAACTITTNGSDTALLLGSAFSSVSILPGERFLVQNVVTNWVIALESASRTTTAPQFDNTIRAATTAFVQKQGVQYSGVTLLGANTTLTASQAGGVFWLTGTPAFTITLPTASTCPIGAVFKFWAPTTAGATIARASTDVIQMNGNSVNSIVLSGGDTLELVYGSPGVWVATSGSVQLGFSGAFLASQTTSGYQRLPTGILIQWGPISCAAGTTSTGTFPLAFPANCFAVTLTGLQATGNQQAYATLNNKNLTGFNWNAFSAVGGSAPVLAAGAASVQGHFMAVGN